MNPIHPLKRIVTWLPGLPDHFANANGFAACGVGVPRDRVTTDATLVTCRRCLKSRCWREAWANLTGGSR